MTAAILTRPQYLAIKKESDLTQEIVKECITYDPDAGTFTWNSNRPKEHFKESIRNPHKIWTSRCAGKPAGWVTSGYLIIGIFGIKARSHRLAWLYMTGELPLIIDHIDGDPLNNKYKNIRSVSNIDNHRNTPIPENNTSGVVGVNFLKGRTENTKPWRAYISANGKQINLGVYWTFEEAVAARKQAEIDYGFHPNHGQKRPTIRSRY